MAKVVFELTKWLLLVEIFHKNDRQEVAADLLKSYVLNKHNGSVTRLNDGREAEVLSQIERIVASAMEISPESEELFERIRKNRSEGRYHHLIRIGHLLSGSRVTNILDQDDSICTTYSLPIREDALPAPIEEKLRQYAKQQRMRRTNGEYPFIRFSRRLLNVLWDKKGSARLSTALLTTWVTNVHQQNQFKLALRSLNLLRDWTGTYRTRTASCLYCLTDEAMTAVRTRPTAVRSGRSSRLIDDTDKRIA